MRVESSILSEGTFCFFFASEDVARGARSPTSRSASRTADAGGGGALGSAGGRGVSAKGAKNETGTFSPTAKSPIAIDPVPSLTGALRSTRLVSCTRHPEDPPPVPRNRPPARKFRLDESSSARFSAASLGARADARSLLRLARWSACSARAARPPRPTSIATPGAHRAPRRGARVFLPPRASLHPAPPFPRGALRPFSPSLLPRRFPRTSGSSIASPPSRRARALRASPPAIPDPARPTPPPIRNRLRAFPRPWRTTPRCSCVKWTGAARESIFRRVPHSGDPAPLDPPNASRSREARFRDSFEHALRPDPPREDRATRTRGATTSSDNSDDENADEE